MNDSIEIKIGNLMRKYLDQGISDSVYNEYLDIWQKLNIDLNNVSVSAVEQISYLGWSVFMNAEDFSNAINAADKCENHCDIHSLEVIYRCANLCNRALSRLFLGDASGAVLDFALAIATSGNRNKKSVTLMCRSHVVTYLSQQDLHQLVDRQLLDFVLANLCHDFATISQDISCGRFIALIRVCKL